MQNQKIKKFLKKTQPNSGFTLTELLAGLFMSVFVTGALGFGLYQIMSATAREKAKTDVRNEASRAVEFISDELRRAQGIEVDMSATNLSTPDDPTTPNDESVAPNFTLPTGGTVRLALQIPGVAQRVVYFVAPPQANSPWQGPLVLFRWGPNLLGNGEYSDPGNVTQWANQALIDGIDNTSQTEYCGTNSAGNPISVSYQGFFACVLDDDEDGVVEDGTVDTNGDGVVDANDSIDDNNGFSETAQIFLTGGIDTIANNGNVNDSNYTAQTRAVARAKDVDVNNAAARAVSPVTFRSLEADYTCNPAGTGSTWTMRTDFDNSNYDSSTSNAYARSNAGMNQATRWIHEPGRQAQPIDITSDNDLTIHSIPVGQNSYPLASFATGGCLSTGNSLLDGFSERTDLSDFVDPSGNGQTVAHTIKFKASVADRPGGNDANFWKSFNGNTTTGYNNPNVKADGTVQVLKNGTTIVPGASIDTTSPTAPAPLYNGYDFDGDGIPDRKSLGEFLMDKGFAEFVNGRDATGGYKIKNLKADERIVAFEVGHTDTTYPGFDLQDNVFIMSHDAFETQY